MTCDQLEYCGDCRNYAKCVSLAKERKLDHCSETTETAELTKV